MSAGVGHVWHMDDMGLVLQVASEDTMRLLTVVDHDYCRKMISFVKATLESLDLNLDTSQAITRPYSGGAVKPDAAGASKGGPPAWRWSECARTPATGPSPCGARPATSTGGRTRTTPAATPRHASASWRGQRRQRGSTGVREGVAMNRGAGSLADPRAMPKKPKSGGTLSYRG